MLKDDCRRKIDDCRQINGRRSRHEVASCAQSLSPPPIPTTLAQLELSCPDSHKCRSLLTAPHLAQLLSPGSHQLHLLETTCRVKSSSVVCGWHVASQVLVAASVAHSTSAGPTRAQEGEDGSCSGGFGHQQRRQSSSSSNCFVSVPAAANCQLLLLHLANLSAFESQVAMQAQLQEEANR